MSKYKIGDVAIVKTWEEMAEEYELIYYEDTGECISLEDYDFLPQMRKFCGKKVTITEVLSDCYGIKEDNGRYGWTEEMFK
jgi:enolase